MPNGTTFARRSHKLVLTSLGFPEARVEDPPSTRPRAGRPSGSDGLDVLPVAVFYPTRRSACNDQSSYSLENTVHFEIRNSTSTTQPFYWRIVGGNGQVLATSETYVRKESCIDAINVVKRNAAAARVDDLTRATARGY